MDLRHSLQVSTHLFTFPFQDARWKEKFLIGSGLLLAGWVLPLLPLLPLFGYCARLVRAGAANSDPTVLPEWDDWGDLVMDGLRIMGVTLLMLLPALLVFLVGSLIYTGGAFSFSTIEDHPRAAGPALVTFLISFFIFFISMGLGTLLSLIGGVMSAPAQAHVAVQRSFPALFDVPTWWRILRANWSGFLLVMLAFMALYMVILFAWNLLYLTIILCFVAPVLLAPLLFYSLVVYYRLAGQAYGAWPAGF